MIDDQSEGGAWRRERLAQPLTVSQLRDMVSELEHCLAVERRKVHELVSRLSDAIVTEMELRGKLEAAIRTCGADNPSAAASSRNLPS
jgi:hypothetical protein